MRGGMVWRETESRNGRVGGMEVSLREGGMVMVVWEGVMGGNIVWNGK